MVKSVVHKNLKPVSELLKTVGPIFLLMIIGFVLTYQFVEPAPSNTLIMSSGSSDGAYHYYAQQLRDILKREDITLDIKTSAGAVDNLQQISQTSLPPSSQNRSEKQAVKDIEVTIIQGGMVDKNTQNSQLVSLGSLYYEPIWVFYHSSLPEVDYFSAFSGKRIAMGPKGSGTQMLAMEIAKHNGLLDNNSIKKTQFLPLSTQNAANALLKNEVDVAFFVGSPQSKTIQKLLYDPNIRLMSFKRAQAYTRLFHFLSSITLPEGIISLKKNIPSKEVTLLTTTANLIVHKEVHPALMSILLQAADETFSKGGWFEKIDEFPSKKYTDFPIAKEAKLYYERGGPPFLQRYLPFWLASFMDRIKIMILPFFALLLPLSKVMPVLYRWRMRSRIYRWYETLQTAEDEPNSVTPSYLDIKGRIKKIDQLEHELTKISVPLSFARELYNLRLHLTMVRNKLKSYQDIKK